VLVINRPITVTINLVVILLNELIWLILAITLTANTLPGLANLPTVRWIFALLSIAIAILLLVLTLFLFIHSRNAYFLSLAFFVITSILVIFDDIGLADIIVLIISLIPVVLLIKDRAWYLKLMPKIEESQ
jgi:hypothetical protein